MSKQKNPGWKKIPATFARLLNDKQDIHNTMLDCEIDQELIPGAIMRYHIVGHVPDGRYTLNYEGKSELVSVLMNNILWDVPVLATDCPKCKAENVAYLAAEHQTGLKLNPPEQTTCVKCGQVYLTDYLQARKKTSAEIDAIGGRGAFYFKL